MHIVLYLVQASAYTRGHTFPTYNAGNGVADHPGRDLIVVPLELGSSVQHHEI